jgi:hypothetical protein
MPAIILSGLFQKFNEQGVNMLKKSDYLILVAAFISFLFSIALWFGILGPNQKEAGIFVGLWVPSILALGIYSVLRSKGDR